MAGIKRKQTETKSAITATSLSISGMIVANLTKDKDKLEGRASEDALTKAIIKAGCGHPNEFIKSQKKPTTLTI